MGALYPNEADGRQTVLGINGNTVVKPTAGRVAFVSVLAAGTTSGAIYDCATIPASTGLIWYIPMAIGIYELRWPCFNGIAVMLGSGQVISISYL